MNERKDSADPVPEMEFTETRLPFDVRIPSDLRYIQRVVDLVARECAQLSFPPHLCSLNVPVALGEALSNAILYGNHEDASKRVRVRACVRDESLVVEVSDEGTGFDLDACTIDPALPGNIAREDGRGLFLMRQLMDSVERFTEGGNVVRLTLHRT